jgi:cobalt transporter subunit CbtB
MSSIPNVASESRAQSSRILASVAAALLGLALVYLAGFAQADALHDGAHDARHSAAFPCH